MSHVFAPERLREENAQLCGHDSYAEQQNDLSYGRGGGTG